MTSVVIYNYLLTFVLTVLFLVCVSPFCFNRDMAFDTDELNQLKQLFQENNATIEEKIDAKIKANNDDLIYRFKRYFASKHDVEEITRRVVREETHHLPSKNDFFAKMDEVLKKYENFEVNKAGLEAKQQELQDRVELIEDKLALSS